MLTTVLLAALGAAPVDVVAFDDEAHGLAHFKKAAGNRTVIDASALHHLLRGRTEGPLPLRDFQAFTQVTPPGWPAPLNGVWSESLKSCLDRVGPPPWKGNAITDATVCGERVGQFLWQRYLEQMHADRVFEIQAYSLKKTDEGHASGTTYSPRSPSALVASHDGSAAQTGVLEEQVIDELLAGKGTTATREVISELASPAIDPFVGQAEVTTKVALKRTCDQLPKALTVTPANALGKSLAARWAASVSSSQPALSCAVNITEHTENGMGMMPSMEVVTGSLQCGKTTVAADVAKQMPKGGKTGLELLSERLVAGLAARLCP